MAPARILSASDPTSLKEAAEVIRGGGLVAFPTETVYGLGADACNPAAVARVFEAKRRPRLDPLIVHVSGPAQAEGYGDLTDERARVVIERFWPGPLTVVVRRREIVPLIVTAGLETVALRMPAHTAALGLIRESRTAIAAPSANPFGYVSPTEANHVSAQLSESVDIILDGGKCAVGVESTIISFTGSRPCLLRAGGTPLEELEEILGALNQATETAGRPHAPGQLPRHYATSTQLQIMKGNPDEWTVRPGERIGVLALESFRNPERYSAVEILSPSGQLREAAANFFAALRRLDSLGLDRLMAQAVPETGLGAAIMDRLRRCSVEP